MIKVKNITKNFGALKAVDNISFTGSVGTVVGFLGPNGAGKSTTMRMISGYMPPTAGEIYINGVNVNKNPLKTKRLIGYLPEDNPLYGEMTPLDYLEFCGRVRDMEPNLFKKRIKEVVDICAIRKVVVKPINTLSKGFRQRVGLAQAILHDPPILILDEPTSGLDPNQIEEIRNLISKLKEQKLIILSTHIMQEAQASCGRIIIINKGRIAADGDRRELTSVSKKQIYNFKFDGPVDDIIKK
nr:ATP-binding cassette domain-containing protein [Elusimicrobiota bacterium]